MIKDVKLHEGKAYIMADSGDVFELDICRYMGYPTVMRVAVDGKWPEEIRLELLKAI